MEAYRDQYATLFNNGRGVVVLTLSADADTLLANWAREKELPFVMGSDIGGTAGKLYGAYNEQRKVDMRFLYVIGPDGKITHTAKPFSVLNAEHYTRLGEAVAKTLPPKKEGT